MKPEQTTTGVLTEDMIARIDEQYSTGNLSPTEHAIGPVIIGGPHAGSAHQHGLKRMRIDQDQTRQDTP
ncbi:hypothetical protein QS713_04130 [Gleimia hominis]|uniref:Uncharacterized protein n=1 Tax=Gleimia hominis TaxID=595468 RepID=A0ABU3IDE0_9ACTO|nr:hypothetical protein [Gleimia hominis]MDT3767255.1 hypothetical protein [Gleimia hominis]